MGQEKSYSVTISAIQCKMARAATGLGVRDLADIVGSSPNTITRLERGEQLRPNTIAAVRAALEAAGVEFIEENGGGQGVRMRK
ncbi:MAG: helix-turn-helix transcriptional regulator [Roseovarius sp.]|uniref:helix-turn-helix domain-containing protein n=1 Tax=Roseovarius sp. TaxID=1486281 RepID=UPI0032F070BD